jgi:hypothetical protein
MVKKVDGIAQCTHSFQNNAKNDPKRLHSGLHDGNVLTSFRERNRLVGGREVKSTICLCHVDDGSVFVFFWGARERRVDMWTPSVFFSLDPNVDLADHRAGQTQRNEHFCCLDVQRESATSIRFNHTFRCFC